MKDTEVTPYLLDILEQAENIMNSVRDMSYQEYLETPLYHAGIIRFFEVIGEASKHIPDEFRDKHPDVPWRKLSGLRDRLIHGYGAVNLKYVWELAVNEIPVLHRQITKILSELES